MPTPEVGLADAGWVLATLACYAVGLASFSRWPRWWLSPVAVAPALLIGLTAATRTGYDAYLHATGWLTALLGPATVAFAWPIYEQRALIRRHWRALLAGILVGSTLSAVTAWAMATWLGLPDALRLSVLPRSVSTPFAMPISAMIGGVPNLTALIVIVTGLVGGALGHLVLAWLPIRSALARGAMWGMGAHGVGTTIARHGGPEEHAVAGLVMVLAGLLNVLVAPLLAWWLR